MENHLEKLRKTIHEKACKIASVEPTFVEIENKFAKAVNEIETVNVKVAILETSTKPTETFQCPDCNFKTNS